MNIVNPPLVSVSVVTYNHKDYIKQCLDGILMQHTNFPFEVILGEDESDDGTREICKTYAAQYPDKIRLFLRSRKDVIYINGRPTGRFNMIENLKVCKGKYIALCEGDDYWTDPMKLQKQVDFLESSDDSVVCFHQSQSLKDDRLIENKNSNRFLGHSFNYKVLLENFNFIATASVVFKRPENFRLPKWFKKVPFGDLGIYKLLSINGSFYGLEDSMAVYRVNDQGLYSGIGKIKARKLFLDFYSVIYNVLNKNEKKIADQKIYEISRTIANLKYPRRLVVRSLFLYMLRLWYFIKKYSR